MTRRNIILAAILLVVVATSLLIGGPIFLKSRKQGGQEGEQKTDPFDRFPNSSNKGDRFGHLAIDGDFIWVANGEGLIRYDKKSGEQKVFTEADGLLGNETWSLVKYKDEVWVTSAGSGISILNTKDNSWRYFTTANGLIDDKNPILTLGGHIVRLTTLEGIQYYDFTTDTWVGKDEGKIKFHSDTEKKQYNPYWNSWDFNKNGDIAILDSKGKSGVVKTAFLKQYCPKVRHAGSDGESIEDGYKEEFNFDDDVLWFGCHQGFALYDLSSKTWSFKETSPNYPAKIYGILAVKDGTLLVDSNLGLGLVTPDGRKWIFIKSLEGTEWSRAFWDGDDIYFLEHFLGVFGSYKPSRLWKYSVTEKAVSRVKTSGKLPFGKPIGQIDDTLWFGYGGGFEGFNLISGKTTSYEPKTKKGESAFIEHETIAKKGNVFWFVSNLGLGNFDTSSKEFEFIADPSGIEFPGWGGADRLGVAGDRVWIALENDPDYAVYVYDPAAETWEHIVQPDSVFGIDEVRYLVGASNHLLMSGTSYVDSSQRKNGDDSTWPELVEDGEVYYERRGLNVYDITNDKWGYFTPEDGMLDGEIGDMYVDGDTVWFAHQGIYADFASGIWRLNLKKLK